MEVALEPVCWILGKGSQCEEQYEVEFEEGVGSTPLLRVRYFWANAQCLPDPNGGSEYTTEDIDAIRRALAENRLHVKVQARDGWSFTCPSAGSSAARDFRVGHVLEIALPPDEGVRNALESLLAPELLSTAASGH